MDEALKPITLEELSSPCRITQNQNQKGYSLNTYHNKYGMRGVQFITPVTLTHKNIGLTQSKKGSQDVEIEEIEAMIEEFENLMDQETSNKTSNEKLTSGITQFGKEYLVDIPVDVLNALEEGKTYSMITRIKRDRSGIPGDLYLDFLNVKHMIEITPSEADELFGMIKTHFNKRIEIASRMEEGSFNFFSEKHNAIEAMVSGCATVIPLYLKEEL